MPDAYGRTQGSGWTRKRAEGWQRAFGAPFLCDCRRGCGYVGDLYSRTPRDEPGEPCVIAGECCYHGEDRASDPGEPLPKVHARSVDHDWQGAHTCHAECPCHKGGIPVPDFAGDACPHDVLKHESHSQIRYCADCGADV